MTFVLLVLRMALPDAPRIAQLMLAAGGSTSRGGTAACCTTTTPNSRHKSFWEKRGDERKK